MTAAAASLERSCARPSPRSRRPRSPQELVEVRARFLGKKGSLSGVLRGLGALPPDERAALGAAANAAQGADRGAGPSAAGALEAARRRRARSRAQRLDVTLPGAAPPRGHLHPDHADRARRSSRSSPALGFSVEDGPEVETDWNNFDALNIPADHPARDMQDTFFVDGGHVLRTHTSPVQIRAMSGPHAAVPLHRARPRLPQRPRRHALADVPPGRGLLVGRERHVRRPEGHALRLRAPPVRRRDGAALPRALLPVHRASAEIDFRWRERLARVGRLRHDPPARAAQLRHRPGALAGLRVRHGARPHRDAALRHPDIQLLFDGDCACWSSSDARPARLARGVDRPPAAGRRAGGAPHRRRPRGRGHRAHRPGPVDVRVGHVLERARSIPTPTELSLCRVDVGRAASRSRSCAARRTWRRGRRCAVALAGRRAARRPPHQEVARSAASSRTA